MQLVIRHYQQINPDTRKGFSMVKAKEQSLKFCSLAITIYHYCNLDLVVMKTKIV